MMLLLVGSTELAGRNVLHLADRGHESRRRGGSGEPRGTTSALWSTNNCRGNHNCRLPGKQEVIPGGVWSFPPFHSCPRQIRPGERGEPKRKSALRPGGQKGWFPQQPQVDVDDSIDRGISVRGGPAGIIPY